MMDRRKEMIKKLKEQKAPQGVTMDMEDFPLPEEDEAEPELTPPTTFTGMNDRQKLKAKLTQKSNVTRGQ